MTIKGRYRRTSLFRVTTKGSHPNVQGGSRASTPFDNTRYSDPLWTP